MKRTQETKMNISPTSLFSWRRVWFPWNLGHPFSDRNVKKSGAADGAKQEPKVDAKEWPPSLRQLQSQGRSDLNALANHWENYEPRSQGELNNLMRQSLDQAGLAANRELVWQQKVGKYQLDHNGDLPSSAGLGGVVARRVFKGLVLLALVGESILAGPVFSNLGVPSNLAYLVGGILGVVMAAGAHYLGEYFGPKKEARLYFGVAMMVFLLTGLMALRGATAEKKRHLSSVQEQVLNEDWDRNLGADDRVLVDYNEFGKKKAKPAREEGKFVPSQAYEFVGFGFLTLGCFCFGILVSLWAFIPHDLKTVLEAEANKLAAQKDSQALRHHAELKKARHSQAYLSQKNGAEQLVHRINRLKDLYADANLRKRQDGQEPKIFHKDMGLEIPKALRAEGVKTPGWDKYLLQLEGIEAESRRTLDRMRREAAEQVQKRLIDPQPAQPSGHVGGEISAEDLALLQAFKASREQAARSNGVVQVEDIAKG